MPDRALNEKLARALCGEAVACELIAAGDVVFDADERLWLVCGPAPRLELRFDGPLPEGWVLLRARILAWPERGSTRLHADLGTERKPWIVSLPVSRRGTLLELVKFPRGTQALFLETAVGSDAFQIEDFELSRAHSGERVLRMWQRVGPMLARHSRSVRQRHGLSVRHLVTDLTQAYQAAGRLRDYQPMHGYAEWRDMHFGLNDHDRREIRWAIKRMPRPPCFVVTVLGNDEVGIRTTLASIKAQLYPAALVQVLVWPGAPTNQVCDTDDWELWLPAGTVLTEDAIFWLASRVALNTQARVVYADHDLLDAEGLVTPHAFKPDWSPELLRSWNYIGWAVAVRGAALSVTMPHEPAAAQYARLLAATRGLQDEQILHVAAPILQVPADVEAAGNAPQVQVMAEHLKTVGVNVDITPGHERGQVLRYHLGRTVPLVSIVVPTRNALTYLRACVESVLGRSTYPSLELLVIDNQSDDPAALEYLATLANRPRVRVLRYEQAFNFSAINNFAARAASGALLCLLNNDTEVITPDWLEVMVSQLLQPGVGAVGAKLYFSNGRIQHAGDAVGPGGCADHFYSGAPHDEIGYRGRVGLVHEVSAATGACLLTRKSLYNKLRGLDEVNLPIAFNDVDYCLRLREAGWRVLWTPQAELFHHESVSRGKDLSPEKRARADRELAYMRLRWARVLRHDPYYNPNLNYDFPDFSLGREPRVERPW